MFLFIRVTIHAVSVMGWETHAFGSVAGTSRPSASYIGERLDSNASIYEILVLQTMVASFLLVSYLAAAFTSAADVPTVAFSSVIPEKVLATAKQLSSHAGSYPHITNYNNPTQWVWAGADWWTSGFFPATLYALNERASLCKSSEGLDIANWLVEGQSASNALIPLTNGNSQVCRFEKQAAREEILS
jgi:hypothetical protein